MSDKSPDTVEINQENLPRSLLQFIANAEDDREEIESGLERHNLVHGDVAQ